MGIFHSTFEPGREVYEAAMIGDLDRLKNAEKRGGSLGWTNPRGWTPLMAAAYHCQIAIVLYLVGRKVDLNTRNNVGQSALHLAAIHNWYVIAGILLKDGSMNACIVATDGASQGMTAWDIAYERKYLETLELIRHHRPGSIMHNADGKGGM